jgi:hypothetical protein
MGKRRELSPEKKRALHDGLVIPAHPLALNEDRNLDERHQRALTRYYIDSGAGGIAVGVHSTQFEIRDPAINLYKPVLSLASEEVEAAVLTRPFIKVAGICGDIDQAVSEVEIAVELGYDAGLLSMGGLQDYTETQLLRRTERLAEIIPIFGFYLQASVGGRILSYEFWKEFANIDGVVAIKIAPFNRYQTIDVVRAVCNSNRYQDIALYTGNDDNIVTDLLTTYSFNVNGKHIKKQISGGLLGHWAVWTEKAVKLLEEIKHVRKSGSISTDWLKRNIEVTDANAALFDPAHHFAGCIPGIHEVLRRQGLLKGTWCLNPKEVLSDRQKHEIDRIYQDYPHLNDDNFVKANLKQWLTSQTGERLT